MTFRGIRQIGALFYDRVSFDIDDGACVFRALDGTTNRSGWATLSPPTARKLALAILKAVDAAEGK